MLIAFYNGLELWVRTHASDSHLMWLELLSRDGVAMSRTAPLRIEAFFRLFDEATAMHKPYPEPFITAKVVSLAHARLMRQLGTRRTI